MGASAAGVIGIVILGLNETTVSLLALAAAIGTAVAIYALSYKGGFRLWLMLRLQMIVAAIFENMLI